MSNLSKESVLAVLVADIHLSVKRPACRLEQEPWADTMARYCRQLRLISERFQAPVVCGGDVFDRWNAPPALINFAIYNLPKMYAVPGQHDLPDHSYEDIGKSAYWTLVEAGIIINLLPGEPQMFGSGLCLTGFPWGYEVQPRRGDSQAVNLAVIHEYIWKPGRSYPGASETGEYRAFSKKLKGYDAALFGDNHKGFTIKSSGCWIHNNGTFMRRASDEKDYQPCVGLLLVDGTVKRFRLKTDSDMIAETIDQAERAFDMESFIGNLCQAGESDIDYKQVVEDHMKRENTPEPIAREVRRCMQND